MGGAQSEPQYPSAEDIVTANTVNEQRAIQYEQTINPTAATHGRHPLSIADPNRPIPQSSKRVVPNTQQDVMTSLQTP
eukprot:gene1051-12264_t